MLVKKLVVCLMVMCLLVGCENEDSKVANSVNTAVPEKKVAKEDDSKKKASTPIPTESIIPTKSPIPTESVATSKPTSKPVKKKELISLNKKWRYADYSKIHSGKAVLYRASKDRKDIVVGVNAGHGTKGGESYMTYCHPDRTPKLTGGSTAKGAIKATAIASGMSFPNGTGESVYTLKVAQFAKSRLLEMGYDVLMIRDSSDVQLDNIARTVICNNMADCHVAIHFNSDGAKTNRGAFYISVPSGLKSKEPVASVWREDERLGKSLLKGLKNNGYKVMGVGSMAIDLTQTSYSSVPSVDIELGNERVDTSEKTLDGFGTSLAEGIDLFFS